MKTKEQIIEDMAEAMRGSVVAGLAHSKPKLIAHPPVELAKAAYAATDRDELVWALKTYKHILDMVALYMPKFTDNELDAVEEALIRINEILGEK